jgi:hypothetical protein
VNTARQLGFAFGIAALGSVFATRAQSVLADRHVLHPAAAAQALSGGQAQGLLHAVPASARSALDRALRAASVSGVQWSFLVSGVIGVVAGLAVLALVRPAKKEASAAVPEVAAVAHG